MPGDDELWRASRSSARGVEALAQDERFRQWLPEIDWATGGQRFQVWSSLGHAKAELAAAGQREGAALAGHWGAAR